MPPVVVRKQSRLTKRGFSVKSINENSGFEITDKTTSSRLLQSLNHMRCQDSLCDVKLKAHGGTVSAHKNVLAASCEYFNAMFCHQMAESSATEVSLEGVEVNMLQHLVTFMYTGVLQVEKNEVPELAMLTDMLQMNELKDRCVQLMAEEIDINNCIGMLEFAKKFHCEALEKKASSIIRHRFPAVCRSEDLLTVPSDLLAEIISWDDLVLGKPGEDLIVDAVLRWLDHDPEDRCSTFLSEILPHIILTKATSDTLKKLKDYLETQEAEGGKEKIDLQLTLSEGKMRTATYRVCVGGGFLQSRTGPNCPRLDTVESLNITEVELNNLETCAASETRYSHHLNLQWTYIAPLPTLPSFVKAFTIEGNLVCVACKIKESNFEITPSKPECIVFEYSVVRETWEHVSVPGELLGIFAQCFTQMGAMTYCSHRQNLYVMTSSFLVCVHVEVDNEEITMERFEYLQNDLKNLRSLELKQAARQSDDESTAQDVSSGTAHEQGEADREDDLMEDVEESESNMRLCHFCLVALNGQLYLIGGADVKSKTEHTSRASVYMFDVDTKTWHHKAEMSQSRACLTAVALGDDIYAIGGYNRFRLKTAERYDSANDTWHRIADMEKFRSHTTAVALGNNVMVLGGKSYAYGCGGARKVLNVVEVYSPDSNKWTTITAMNSARCMAMAATF